MKVEMRTLYTKRLPQNEWIQRGENSFEQSRTIHPGTIVDLPDDEAQQLIAQHCAIPAISKGGVRKSVSEAFARARKAISAKA